MSFNPADSVPPEVEPPEAPVDRGPSPSPVLDSPGVESNGVPFITTLATSLYDQFLTQVTNTVVLEHTVTDGYIETESDVHYITEQNSGVPELNYGASRPKTLDPRVATERLNACGLPSIKRATTGEITQELEALMYFLGWMTGQEAATIEGLDTAPITWATVSSTLNHGGFSASETVLATGSNAYLFQRICALTNVPYVRVTSVERTTTFGVPTAETLLSDIITAAATLYDACVTVDESADAYAAFMMGAASARTVHGHTQEGGWVRALIRNVAFPRASALLVSSARAFEIFDAMAPDPVILAKLGAFSLAAAAAVTASAPSHTKPTVIILDDIDDPQFEWTQAYGDARDEVCTWSLTYDAFIGKILGVRAPTIVRRAAIR